MLLKTNEAFLVQFRKSIHIIYLSIKAESEAGLTILLTEIFWQNLNFRAVFQTKDVERQLKLKMSFITRILADHPYRFHKRYIHVRPTINRPVSMGLDVIWFNRRTLGCIGIFIMLSNSLLVPCHYFTNDILMHFLCMMDFCLYHTLPNIQGYWHQTGRKSRSGGIQYP